MMHHYLFYSNSTRELIETIIVAEGNLPNMEVGRIVMIRDVSYFISQSQTVTIFGVNEIRTVVFVDEADISDIKQYLNL